MTTQRILAIIALIIAILDLVGVSVIARQIDVAILLMAIAIAV